VLSILPDAVVTNAETPMTINVLANDTGANLTITSFSKPAHGSLVFNGNTSFTYTPSTGFVGDDSFTYTVRDAQGTPASAEVTISVVPNAGTTVATDDVVEVVAGGSVIVPALANDMAADGEALQITAISMPGHGVVNVLPDQTIRYVPQSGFTGTDSFTYTVTDGQGSSASATVIVKVLAQNSPPIAAADTFPVEAGQPTLLAVLANDSDPDGGPLQIVGFTMPSHGSLVFNPDKTFTYTPAAGFLGQDQFTYTIRDNRGASALATVTLVVAEVSQSPIAFDDQVTTEAGQPVTIDVLANDTLPAGQQVAIVAVTLPYRGKLAFNPDKTITYTPNPGFVGIDDFTYTISNGKGGTAKAKVTIEVTTATIIETYANGYGHRRRIVVPASSARGSSHANFPLWVELAGAWLRSASNGGKVASADGHDLRFELADGTKLAHELELYDAVAGRLGAWVRMPELSGSTATILFLYYDKPGLTQSEAAPVAVWQDYLAVWHLPAGVNAGGVARSLTATGTIASSAEGLGAGALALEGNGVLSINDASWLSGHDALSIQLRSRAYSTGNDRGLLGAGQALFAGDGDLIIRYQSIGFGEGQPQNLLHTSITTAAGRLRCSSPANSQTTNWQNIAIAWQSGESQTSLFLDGKKVQPTFVTTINSATSTAIGGPLVIGASTQDSANGGWAGLIDEVRIRASRLSDSWIAAEHANQGTPALFYGFGAEETITEPGDSIVALPIDVTTPASSWVEVDPLATAQIPPGTPNPTIQAASQPANGTVAVINGKIRYTPVAGFVGEDGFSFTLEAAGRASTAQVRVMVEASVSQEQDSSADTNTSYLRTVNVANVTQLTAALSNAQAGDDIVLANGTYSNNFTLAKNGSPTNPIRIRAASAGQATISGQLVLAGQHARADQLRFSSSVGTGNVLIDADNCKVGRCSFTNFSRGIRVNSNRARFVIEYCSFNTGTNGIQILVPTSGNKPVGNGLVRRCYFRACTNNPCEIGQNRFHSARQMHVTVEYNLVEECNGTTSFGCKSSNNIYRYNTIRNCTGGRFQSRSGYNCQFIGNSSINASGVFLRGKGHVAIGNWKDTALTGSWWDHGAPTGTLYEDDYTSSGTDNDYPAGENCLFIGNLPTVRIGGGSGSDPVLARGNRVESSTSSWVLVSGKHTGTTTGTVLSQAAPSHIILQPADVGPQAAAA
jgi:hypothetical protein